MTSITGTNLGQGWKKSSKEREPGSLNVHSLILRSQSVRCEPVLRVYLRRDNQENRYLIKTDRKANWVEFALRPFAAEKEGLGHRRRGVS